MTVAPASRMIERLARFGYAAKGIVYTIAGLLTAAAALGRGGETADHHTAFGFILRQPFGRALLIVLAIGLAGYALWRLGSAAGDWENRGDDAKGWAIRLGSIGRGILYAGFAYEVVRLAMRRGDGGKGSDANARHWTAEAMDAPFGQWLVMAAGAGIVGYGIYQLFAAWKSKLSRKLRLGSLAPQARKRVVAISRFGIAARGVVFGVIGISLISAGLRHDAGQARGTTGALRQLANQPFGEAILALVGFGLAAYGIYALVNARYRQIEA